MIALIVRELRIAWSGGGLLLPVAFFLLVATLFPFAIGPDAAGPLAEGEPPVIYSFPVTSDDRS